jgi:hypothetical protein
MRVESLKVYPPNRGWPPNEIPQGRWVAIDLNAKAEHRPAQRPPKGRVILLPVVPNDASDERDSPQPRSPK